MRLAQNWLLMKNLQFSHNYLETLSRGPPHEKSILTKFQQDLMKSRYFPQVDNFWPSLIFYATVSNTTNLDLVFPRMSSLMKAKHQLISNQSGEKDAKVS